MDQLTSAQLSEWEAYDKLDPIGSWREDYRTASLASLMVNIMKSLYPKSNATDDEIKRSMTTPVDFMPRWDVGLVEEVLKETEPERQPVEDMLAILMDIASTQNKKEEQRFHLPFNKQQ